MTQKFKLVTLCGTGTTGVAKIVDNGPQTVVYGDLELTCEFGELIDDTSFPVAQALFVSDPQSPPPKPSLVILCF